MSKYVYRDSDGNRVGTLSREATTGEILIGSAVLVVGALTALHRKADQNILKKIQRAIVQEDYVLALKKADLLVLRNTKEGEPYIVRAMVYEQIDKITEAIQDLSRAIQNNPNLEQAYVLRAQCNIRMGKWSAALEDISIAIKLNPDEADHWLRRGVVAARIGDTEQALLDLTRSINLNPGNGHAYFERGQVHFAKDDFELALADISRALNLDVERPEYFRLRAEVYEQIGNDKAATLDLQQARDLDRRVEEKVALAQIERKKVAEQQLREEMERDARQIFYLAASSVIFPLWTINALFAIYLAHQRLSRINRLGISPGRGYLRLGLIFGYLHVAAIGLFIILLSI